LITLQVLQGPDRGKRFELPENEPQLIGRSSEALPVTDTTVSRRHAELTPDDGRWFLRDLDSSNGTFVNGTRLRDRLELSPGDQIRVGSTLLVFGVGADERATRIDLLPDEVIDASLVSEAANDDSMILAAPDPLRAAMKHLDVIYALTALTTSTFERDELLRRVMELIWREFDPDRGFVLLMSGPDAAPEPVVLRYRQRPKTVDEGRIPVSRTIIEHTLRSGKGTLSTNAMNDRRFRAGDSVRDYGIRSAICVPVTAGDRTFGIIHIDSQVPNFTFTESQLQLMTAIGQHTGLVLLGAERVHSRMQTTRLAAMGQTVASLSHAIKNILQGLRSGADAVELALNRNDLALAREGWPILNRNLDRIFSLTMNMLAYSRQQGLEVEMSSLNAIVREAADLVKGQAARRRVGLILDLEESVPPTPIDVNAIHQCVMNLLTNALEAVPAKRGVITISTGFDAASNEAILRVSDNGPGIEAVLRDEIFGAFVSTKGQRGTGLGLAVTQKLVEEHGGTVTAESVPGEGATFTIVLPSDRESSDPSETRLPRPRPQPSRDDRFDG
jgi:signal transduction histidine kinase